MPGVEAVATIRSSQAKLLERRRGAKVTAPSPDIEKELNIEWKQGGPQVLRDLRDDQAVLSDSLRLRPRARSRATASSC